MKAKVNGKRKVENRRYSPLGCEEESCNVCKKFIID